MDLSSAVRAVARAVADTPLPGQEVVLFSDLQASALSAGDPVGIRVLVWQPPPPPETGGVPLGVWIGSGLAVALGLVGFAVLQRRVTARAAGPDVAALAREASRALAACLSEPGPRERAERSAAVVWHFVERCWDLDAAPATPADLPGRVETALVEVLRAFDAARFGARPDAAAVAAAGERARSLFEARAAGPGDVGNA